MIKKFLKILILILMIVGIILGISITIKRQVPELSRKNAEVSIINRIQTKAAEATECYTYGRSLNINGKISNVSKDNFESAKLVITNGSDYEKEYTLDYSFDGSDLVFTSTKELNKGIIIDELENSEYYILLRLKLNNSVDAKYYSFFSSSNSNDIEYYTVTKDGTNKKANIEFVEKTYNNNEYSLLRISFEETSLPDDVYDIVIDAGHGGKDKGENAGSVTEADVALEYANSLKTKLENEGYKVKLTRDENNSDSYTYTNMYDSNGRISVACKSKAKLMISFHINQGSSSLSGLEVYCPSNCNLDFASSMASKIVMNSNINYSNNNSYKKCDGVYVWNFTNTVIKEFESTANKKGYEPYPITTSTPYLYTIREVGGIALGAYVDGRNTDYSKNEYYDSNQGIECYQIELGYIKTDLSIITSEVEDYTSAISETIAENY
jgi:N-acetylmuramoyl-L-alanine amidase